MLLKRRSQLAVALLSLLAPAYPATAQVTSEVKRGDLQVNVHVRGTVVAAEMIRLKAQIEGRVEDVQASTLTWVTDGKPLGFLANKEMAAILDSHTTTVKGVVEDRWRKVYQPTPIACPGDCFIMRVFVKNKEWLKPRSLLFEAAQKLQLIGRVRPEDAHLIRDNQTVEYWATNAPEKKYKARIARYVLDIQGEKVEPGGSFTIDLSPKRYFDPGTEWEGLIVPVTRRNVLVVPTKALVVHDGVAYLPVRVSTGITTQSFTEITAGIDSKRPILVLGEAQLGSVQRHAQTVDEEALRRRAQEDAQRKVYTPPPAADDDNPAAPREPARRGRAQEETIYRPTKPAEPERREKSSGAMPEPDATFSETPYGE